MPISSHLASMLEVEFLTLDGKEGYILRLFHVKIQLRDSLQKASGMMNAKAAARNGKIQFHVQFAKILSLSMNLQTLRL